MQSSLDIIYFDLEVNPTSKGILEYGAIFHGKIFWNTLSKKIRYKESIKKMSYSGLVGQRENQKFEQIQKDI